DEDAVRPRSGDFGSIEKNGAFHGRNITADGFQEGRLAAAGGSEDYEPVGLQHVETDAPRRGNQMASCAVLERYAFDCEKRRHAKWPINFPAPRGFRGRTCPSMKRGGS